jgi:hypothetical protein
VGTSGEYSDAGALVTILTSNQAENSISDKSSHPRRAALHLKIRQFRDCDGFVPAAEA